MGGREGGTRAVVGEEEGAWDLEVTSVSVTPLPCSGDSLYPDRGGKRMLRPLRL